MAQQQIHGGPGAPEPEDNTQGVGQMQINGADDLLDEIDGLLETNAEEYVRAYVQKGGQ